MVKIFLSHGIGDFLAIINYMPDEYQRQIREVWYASRVAEQLREIIDHLPHWKVERHHIIPGNYTVPRFKKDECPEVPEDVDDWSITQKFRDIRARRLSFVGTPLYDHELCQTKHTYPVVIHGSTTSDKRNPRELHGYDWGGIMDYLDGLGLEACVIGTDGDCPRYKLITDLRGQTSIVESIEIVKQSLIYLGVDSWASVVAAQDPGKRLFVKCQNQYLHHVRDLMYPRPDFSFITRDFMHLRT